MVISPFKNGRFKLAPAYDVLPTNSGQGYQEFVCGELGRDSTLENAMSECDAFGLSAPEAAVEVARVIKTVEGWQAHFARLGVTQRDINSLAQQIDGQYLIAQRSGFDAARFDGLPIKGTKRTLKNPFNDENITTR
jgi:serine/threonine-protein kinase HipA